jgi:hypothetical protein
MESILAQLQRNEGEQPEVSAAALGVRVAGVAYLKVMHRARSEVEVGTWTGTVGARVEGASAATQGR